MVALEASMHSTYSVHDGTVCIDGLDISYREAGLRIGPVILLLHGPVASLGMLRNLLPRLAGSFRLVAPDYPGYGRSSAPKHTELAYSYENFVHLADKFVKELCLGRYSLYLMDYGAPVGYRLVPTRLISSRTDAVLHHLRNQRRRERRPLAPSLSDRADQLKHTLYSRTKPVQSWSHLAEN